MGAYFDAGRRRGADAAERRHAWCAISSPVRPRPRSAPAKWAYPRAIAQGAREACLVPAICPPLKMKSTSDKVEVSDRGDDERASDKRSRACKRRNGAKPTPRPRASFIDGATLPIAEGDAGTAAIRRLPGTGTSVRKIHPAGRASPRGVAPPFAGAQGRPRAGRRADAALSSRRSVQPRQSDGAIAQRSAPTGGPLATVMVAAAAVMVAAPAVVVAAPAVMVPPPPWCPPPPW